MSVQTGLKAVEEFRRLPPKWGRQRIQWRVARLLSRVGGGRGIAGTDMAFRVRPENEVSQADVGYIRRARTANVADDEYLTGAPDLLVKLVSPSDTVYEINDMMWPCLANGCVSFWLVNPRRKQLSVTESDVTRDYR